MSGIKDARPAETVLPYMVGGNKSRRRQRDSPYTNNAAQRHQSSRAMIYPGVSAENLTYPRPDHRIHSVDVPDDVSSSPVGGNQSLSVDLSTSHLDSRLSQSGPVKQEVVDNSPVFPVAMVSSKELRSAHTSKSAPSSNRRKRQPSAIVRNTSAQLTSGSNFASPASSEDDPIPDFPSTTPSKMCKVTEASAAQSTSETVLETDSSISKSISKGDEFPVDSTTSSPLTAGQSEIAPPPTGGEDVPSTFSKEDNSSFIPPGEWNPVDGCLGV